MPFDTGETMISAAAVVSQPAYDRARAIAQYTGNMRKLIHDYKYRDRHDAHALFVNWMAIAGADLLADADIIMPVPLHRWRIFTRRFNQSALLGRDLAKTHKPVYAPDLLRRIRRTKPQVGLSQAQRRGNLAGAFHIKTSAKVRLDGKRILLVDDVITTGATANACAKVLKNAGASAVDILALALVADQARMTT
ncbi:MAG: ComF family protein [Pseudomonadota bacterium]